MPEAQQLQLRNRTQRTHRSCHLRDNLDPGLPNSASTSLMRRLKSLFAAFSSRPLTVCVLSSLKVLSNSSSNLNNLLLSSLTPPHMLQHIFLPSLSQPQPMSSRLHTLLHPSLLLNAQPQRKRTRSQPFLMHHLIQPPNSQLLPQPFAKQPQQPPP
ncbi:hypothetical protein BC829DRAFT_297654 [Chytridium lagenaria]|nr:hypothetical protein BC829DRAFT_297654 [Chytridium lagenaria]